MPRTNSTWRTKPIANCGGWQKKNRKREIWRNRTECLHAKHQIHDTIQAHEFDIHAKKSSHPLSNGFLVNCDEFLVVRNSTIDDTAALKHFSLNQENWKKKTLKFDIAVLFYCIIDAAAAHWPHVFHQIFYLFNYQNNKTKMKKVVYDISIVLFFRKI